MPTLNEQLPTSRLRDHPANVRDDLGDLSELAASIRAQGILQPITVQPHPAEPGAFLILAGHRRVAAAKIAGLSAVPVIIRPPVTGQKAIEIMLVENCRRRDLGPIEKAEAMGKLRRRGLTAADIARAIGMSAANVSYYLSLLDLDEASRERVRNGDVRVGDAVGAVRSARRRTRGKPGRPAAALPEHFSHRHPLADKARLRCQLAGHEAPKYGRDRAGKTSKVACGECWEYVIRADERGEDLPADQPTLSAREERLRAVAALPMLHDPAPDGGHVTAGQASERLGVTKRTVERYKRDLLDRAQAVSGA